jgi:4-hydroxy 2-oxovalerate aldolase
MENYGASAVIIMDSSGNFIPRDVSERVDALKSKLKVEVGFHAHNNLGVAVSNAITAEESGATIIDGASMGLGAGAGNAQLENIVAISGRDNDLKKLNTFYSMSQIVENSFPENLPRVTSSSIQSGMAGVFSGYAPQVKALAQELGIEAGTLWSEMAKRKLVAGQESMIREIAQDLMNL